MIKRCGGVYIFVAMMLITGISVSFAVADIRKPVVNGAFYPNDADTLSHVIRKYLNEVTQKQLTTDPFILIVPHAGYVYSGPVAAYAYKEIDGVKYDTVIVIAFSHHTYYPGISIYDGEGYATPLGVVPIDQDIVKELKMRDPWFTYYPPAHAREHSLEVQLPFLQETVPDLKIVPLVMCDMSEKSARRLVDALYPIIADKKALVVISTDLSHYEPYNEAKMRDARTIDIITSLSLQKCLEGVKGNKLDACGKGPLLAAMMLAEISGANEATVLKYANSGDTAGDKSRVVGYTSIAIIKNEGEEAMEENNVKSEQLISDAGRAKLLSLARQSLQNYFTTSQKNTVEVDDTELQAKNGAFVTLHKQGRLRGCIGCFTSNDPLYKTVQEFVLNSALRDPRFPPLRVEELKDIEIEISVLSSMRKINNIDEIVLGKHGIWIKKGFRSGTFLPQVATETGWSKEEFLGHCAQDKAGIGWDGWKDAELFVYTAEVFNEE
ncbi:MAG: AmmeMemoRadiSam system protein B [Candidatus Omnitrophica bacterium]|nr:AmmeMemoRadiSam system protein B [Candidatus Omnitrophota bacterium]